MQLTEEQILNLAPDDSSKKSGKDLANPSKWVSKGANENALWGECQGSGSKPYQTQVHLKNLAFKCSCPSRKFPCKHGLGLSLLYARQPKQFQVSESPAWVNEWLDKRTEKEEKKSEKKDKPVDEEAQAKRQLARQKKVTDGVEELLLWIKDIVRNGIINIPEKGRACWENISKRMIDAQAPGLAGMLRNIGDINFYEEGWQSRFLDQLLKIYLIICGYKNMDHLDVPTQEDIRSLIGFTQNQDEIKEKKGIRDEWFVLAKKTTEEEQLFVERNWLYGTNTKQYALVLQFYVRSQLPALVLTPGIVADAELVFYNSALPLRALVKEQFHTKKIPFVESYANWNEVVAKQTYFNSVYPFAETYPFIIGSLRPVFYQKAWWLQDIENNMMPVKNNYRGIWKLLSISAGERLTMAVIGKEDEYEPVGLWNSNEYKTI